MTKDPDFALFKRLESLQPCEILELNPGCHVFAVYGWYCFYLELMLLIHFFSLIIAYKQSSIFLAGDNFFKPATYTIEALCAKSYNDTTDKLKVIEAKILRKRNELKQFETEYRMVFLVPCSLCYEGFFQYISPLYIIFSLIPGAGSFPRSHEKI